MTGWRKGGAFGAGILVLAAAMTFAGNARADCDPFPKVEWWGALNHDKVRNFVDSKFDGDWAPYVEKWERRRVKPKRIAETNMELTIKSANTVIKGAALDAYIAQVGARVEVIRCLAAAEGSSDFDTDEGGMIKPASQ